MTKKIKVAINGLGRIGRHIFKMCIDHSHIELVGINEINPDLNNWAYTLNYDSIYGQSKKKSEVIDNKIKCALPTRLSLCTYPTLVKNLLSLEQSLLSPRKK